MNEYNKLLAILGESDIISLTSLVESFMVGQRWIWGFERIYGSWWVIALFNLDELGPPMKPLM